MANANLSDFATKEALGFITELVAGADISITGSATRPQINYTGGAGAGVLSVNSGTNINVGGTPANPVVNVVDEIEVPDGGYIGIGGAVLPAPPSMANCLRLYKNPARTLWSAFLTAPIPPPPMVGGDSVVMVNESKDFDALAVGNLKVFNQGDDYDVVNAFLHFGAVGASQFAIAYNDPVGMTETLFMDTNTAPPLSFNLHNILQLNGVEYFIPTLGGFLSTINQPILPNPPLTPIPLRYNTTLQSYNGVIFDPANPSHIVLPSIGTYSIISSIQLNNTGGGTHSAYVWINQNGTPVPNSNSVKSCGNNELNILTIEWIVRTAVVNEFVEVVFTSDDPTGSTFPFVVPAAPTYPLSPSIITSAKRIA